MCIAQFEKSVTLGSPMTISMSEAERRASTVLDSREAAVVILAVEAQPDIRPEAMPDLLRRSALRPQNQLQSVQGIDGDALAHKLELLDYSVLRAVIAGARTAVALPSSFLLAAQGCFEQQALRAAGLAPLPEKAAAGLVVVMLSDHHVEVLVRHHASEIDIHHDFSLEEVGRCLCDHVELAHAGCVEAYEDLGYKLACFLLKKSGSSYLRVARDWENSVIIEEIAVDDLRSDLVDGSLQPLVLAGVNAPSI